jgi:glycosyltransferase involved in cell wall biosynthesis
MQEKKGKKFSIICPSWNRENIISLAINSVIDQTYSDWELIFIDDGSDDNTQEVLKKYAPDPRIKVITHEKSRERLVSWNEGMRAASGDWICFLDSDDELIFGYLEILKHNIEKYPEYNIFHYGHLVVSLDGATVKVASEIAESPDGRGMEYFDCGIVGAGSFVFKKELLNEKTMLPNLDNIYDFADWFGERVKEYWKERNLPGECVKYGRDDKFVGNPWGQDHALFWLLTRENKSKKLPLLPYVAYIRTEPWLYERAYISGTMRC